MFIRQTKAFHNRQQCQIRHRRRRYNGGLTWLLLPWKLHLINIFPKGEGGLSESGGEGRFALALKLRKFLDSEKEDCGGGEGVESQGGKERKATTCSWRKDLIWCSIICSAVSSGGRVNHCRDNVAPPPLPPPTLNWIMPYCSGIIQPWV